MDTFCQVLEECLKCLSVKDSVWSPTRDGHRMQVYFTMPLADNDHALHYLNSMGFGLKRDTEVGFVPFGLYYDQDDTNDDSG